MRKDKNGQISSSQIAILSQSLTRFKFYKATYQNVPIKSRIASIMLLIVFMVCKGLRLEARVKF